MNEAALIKHGHRWGQIFNLDAWLFIEVEKNVKIKDLTPYSCYSLQIFLKLLRLPLNL